MLRSFFIYLSQQKNLRRWMEHSTFAKPLTRRFIAGNTLEHALAVCQSLNRQGFLTTLDHLGESVSLIEEANLSRDHCLQALRLIHERKIDSTISIKLTQMGLDIDESLCFENARQLVALATQTGSRVEFDMESSAYTDRTLSIVERLHAEFGCVRAVLQAYLFRTEADIVELRSNVLIDNIYLLDTVLEQGSFERLENAEQRLYLDRHHAPAIASAGVRLALAQADIIVYSAGTQHSSLYPTYMSRGLPETIARNRSALKVFVTNIGADYETPSYAAADFLHGAYRYLCMAEDRHYAPEDLFDAVLVNNGRRKSDTSYVDYEDADYRLAIPRIVDDFEHPDLPGRHNGERLVSTFLDLYAQRDLIA